MIARCIAALALLAGAALLSACGGEERETTAPTPDVTHGIERSVATVEAAERAAATPLPAMADENGPASPDQPG